MPEGHRGVLLGCLDLRLGDECDERRDALKLGHQRLRGQIVGGDGQQRTRRLRLRALRHGAKPRDQRRDATRLGDRHLVGRVVAEPCERGQHAARLLRILGIEEAHETLGDRRAIVAVLRGERRQRARRVARALGSGARHKKPDEGLDAAQLGHGRLVGRILVGERPDRRRALLLGLRGALAHQRAQGRDGACARDQRLVVDIVARQRGQAAGGVGLHLRVSRAEHAHQDGDRARLRHEHLVGGVLVAQLPQRVGGERRDALPRHVVLGGPCRSQCVHQQGDAARSRDGVLVGSRFPRELHQRSDGVLLGGGRLVLLVL